MSPETASSLDFPVDDLDAGVVDLIQRDAVRIPPYPAVAMKLTRLLADDRTSAEALAKVVQLDQAVTAAVMRTATSAANARGSAINTLPKAIQRLGSRALQQIVFSVCFGEVARTPGRLVAMRERVWRHAVTSAFVAQALADGRQVLREEAFLCGLLHDFGKVIALSAFETLIGRDDRCLTEAQWFDLVDRYHVELGVIVASTWGLPELLGEAMSAHHAAPSASRFPELVELLHTTDAVADHLEQFVGVTEADVVRMPFARPTEERLVCDLVARFPAQLAAMLNASSAAAAALPGAVAPNADRSDWRAVDVPAVVRDSGTLTYRVRYFHPRGFVVRGPVPLTEGHLHAFELDVDGFTLSVWAHPRFITRDGDAWLIDVKPYASSGEAMSALVELLDDSANVRAA